jgi:hypothetical protein
MRINLRRDSLITTFLCNFFCVKKFAQPNKIIVFASSYTGHGSGSQYYPSDEVQKLRIQACSILMGCSSGNQYVLGEFEPYGTILAYIIAGW